MNSLLYTTNNADLSDHMFVVHAAVILKDARILYREAWRLRRIMFQHARDNGSYAHYRQQFQNIKHTGPLGEQIVKQIEAVANQTLGTF